MLQPLDYHSTNSLIHMKSIHLILAALIISSLTSCSLIGSILKIPGGILKTVGRTVGLGLTDEAPSPIEESPIIEAPQTQTEFSKAQPEPSQTRP